MLNLNIWHSISNFFKKLWRKIFKPTYTLPYLAPEYGRIESRNIVKKCEWLQFQRELEDLKHEVNKLVERTAERTAERNREQDEIIRNYEKIMRQQDGTIRRYKEIISVQEEDLRILRRAVTQLNTGPHAIDVDHTEEMSDQMSRFAFYKGG